MKKEKSKKGRKKKWKRYFYNYDKIEEIERYKLCFRCGIKNHSS